MNRETYNSDSRYAKVLETMDLLGIMDVSTTRQAKNGTIAWRLPIKNTWPGNKNASYIEVASFKTGYVRNQNSGYSNYQLNKRCEGEPEYYPVYEWCDESNMSIKTDKFRQFITRSCKLIPIEIDRLEYLLKYCVKNYYIKNANQVPNGQFYPKWMYDSVVKEKENLQLHNRIREDQETQTEGQNVKNVTVTIDGSKFRLI